MEYNTPDMSHYNKPKADLRQSVHVQESLKHSGLGIASFVMSVIGFVGIFILIFVVGMMSLNGQIDENSENTLMFIGLILLIFLGVELAALILGIVGWTQKNRKNVFGILGTVFSALVLVGMIAIIMLGVAAG